VKEFDKLIQEYFGKLTDEELTTIISYFSEEKLCSHNFFTRSGEFCDRLRIIKSGILEVYGLSGEKEVPQWISTFVKASFL